MVRATYEAVSLEIPKQELVVAAKNFLQHDGPNKDLILLNNIHSPKFGSSDLLFVNKAKTNLTIVRLNDKANYEKFIISSISYYLWLKELVTVGESFFHGKSELEMYLFSHDFSAAICYLIDSLAKKFRVYLVKYNILQVEGFDEPAIYFQHMTLEDFPKDKLVVKERREEDPVSTEEKETSASGKISAQELSEFNRLKDRHLA